MFTKKMPWVLSRFYAVLALCLIMAGTCAATARALTTILETEVNSLIIGQEKTAVLLASKNSNMTWNIADTNVVRFVVDGKEQTSMLTQGTAHKAMLRGRQAGSTEVSVNNPNGVGRSFTVTVSYLDPPSLSDFTVDKAYWDGSAFWLKEGTYAKVTPPEGYVFLWNGSDISSISFAQTAEKTVYLKRISDGAQTDAIDLSSVLQWSGSLPAGSIALGSGESWTEPTSSVENVWFFKDTQSVTIEADDAGGVDFIEYCLIENIEEPIAADEESIAIAVGGAWHAYNGAITLSDPGRYVVCARLSDKMGNERLLSSGTIVIYQDPALAEGQVTSLSHTKYSGDLSVRACLNGNSVQTVKLGDTLLTTKDYRIETEEDVSRIVLSEKTLAEMEPEEYPLTISVKPRGVAYTPDDKPADLTVMIEIISHTISWGEEIERSCDQIPQYIDIPGRTSVELKGQYCEPSGRLWLQEYSEGIRSWYGIDLSGHREYLDEGMRFYVQQLSEKDAAFSSTYAKVDDELKASVEDDHSNLFLVGLLNADGERVQPKSPIDLYVQIDDDWDAKDVEAVYVSSGADERLIESTGSMKAPDGEGVFARITLSHFSPHFVFDVLNPGEEGAANDLPQTGDESRLGLWFGLLAVCILALRMRRRAEV